MALLILKKVFFLILKFLIYFIIFSLLYLLVAYLLSRITVNEKQEYSGQEVVVFLKSNGVHTDLVLPIHHEQRDWSKKLPPENNRKPDSNYRYIALGWGDKGFYLNTPTWGDLTFSTAFKAVFGLSSTAMHVTYYEEMEANDSSCVRIPISGRQYELLCQFVDRSFRKKADGSYQLIPTKAVYSDHDAFYEAKGTYSLFRTCNTWTNQALKHAKMKAAFWTAFQSGIFCHYLP
ncbi:MAG: TIGR02117 family protein [Bacteroidetes bacterium]|nr:MAG: TIGR02117 family protein [Bacteroidota bacterium]